MPDRTKTPKHNILAAWLVGLFGYMFLALDVIGEDSFLAIPFQLVMGAVFSIVFEGIVAVIGQFLRIPAIGRFWYASPVPSLVTLGLAACLIVFGMRLGLVTVTSDPEALSTHTRLHPLAICGAILIAMFAALHFPQLCKATEEKSATR